MALRNSETAYGRLTITLHWLMSLMVIGMVIVGFVVDGMEKGPDKSTLVGLHISTGVIVLVLALFRWYWTLSSKKLNPVEGITKLEKGLGHAAKWLLMLAIVIMPLSGMLMIMSYGKSINVYGLFEIAPFVSKSREAGGFFGSIHGYMAWFIVIVVGIHVLGAIRHHFIKKDDTLNRMLGK